MITATMNRMLAHHLAMKALSSIQHSKTILKTTIIAQKKRMIRHSKTWKQGNPLCKEHTVLNSLTLRTNITKNKFNSKVETEVSHFG